MRVYKIRLSIIYRGLPNNLFINTHCRKLTRGIMYNLLFTFFNKPSALGATVNVELIKMKKTQLGNKSK